MSRTLTFGMLIWCLFWALPGWTRTEAPPLRIAVNVPYPPFTAVTETGEIFGFDVDIAKALCKELRRPCEIIPMYFNEIIPAILAEKIDMAVAGMGATEERKKLVDFTERYYRSLSIYIEIPGSLEDISVASMKGRRLGAQAGTLQESYLISTFGNSITLVTEEDFGALMRLVKERKVDAVLVDGLAGYAYLKSAEGGELETIGKPIASDVIRDFACVAVSKKQPELREAINKAIQNLRRSGEYGKINRKYFDFIIY